MYKVILLFFANILFYAFSIIYAATLHFDTSNFTEEMTNDPNIKVLSYTSVNLATDMPYIISRNETTTNKTITPFYTNIALNSETIPYKTEIFDTKNIKNKADNKNINSKKNILNKYQNNTSVTISSGTTIDTSTSEYDEKDMETNNGGKIKVKTFKTSKISNKSKTIFTDINGILKAMITAQLDMDIIISDDGNSTLKTNIKNTNGDTALIEIDSSTDKETNITHKLTLNGITTTLNSNLDNTITNLAYDGIINTATAYEDSNTNITSTIKTSGKTINSITLSNNNTTSEITFDIAGSITSIKKNGEVETYVTPINYIDKNDCSIKIKTVTNENSETYTGFVKTCNGTKSTIQTLANDKRFKAGSNINIYEKNNDVYIDVTTPLVHKMVF